MLAVYSLTESADTPFHAEPGDRLTELDTGIPFRNFAVLADDDFAANGSARGFPTRGGPDDGVPGAVRNRARRFKQRMAKNGIGAWRLLLSCGRVRLEPGWREDGGGPD